MTVEERAQKAVEKFCEDEKELRGPDGKRSVSFVAYSSRLRQRISEALRDQIEECAKVANKQKQEFDEGCWVGQCKDGWANQACLIIGHDIRALAGQTDQTEGKERK